MCRVLFGRLVVCKIVSILPWPELLWTCDVYASIKCITFMLNSSIFLMIRWGQSELYFQLVSTTSKPPPNTFGCELKTFLSQTWQIFHKQYTSLWKCTGWPFYDLDRRWRVRHEEKFSGVTDELINTHQMTTKLSSCMAIVMVIK